MPLSVKKNDEFTEDLSEVERLVVDCFKKHIALMLADEWYITVRFAPINDHEEAMDTTANPEYRSAVVTVDMDRFSEQREHLDKYVRHELLHVLVWQFFDIAGTLAYKNAARALEKIEESVIDRLEHMPLWERLYGESEET